MCLTLVPHKHLNFGSVTSSSSSSSSHISCLCMGYTLTHSFFLRMRDREKEKGGKKGFELECGQGPRAPFALAANSCWQTRATNIDLICTCLQIHLARRVAHIAYPRILWGRTLRFWRMIYAAKHELCAPYTNQPTTHHPSAPPTTDHRPLPIASTSFKWVKPCPCLCPSQGDPLDQRLFTGYLRYLRASGLAMPANGLLRRLNGSVMHTLLAFPC